MLSFILGLLKILGIILLVLLSLVLVVLCIILFVPIRYSATGLITDAVKKADIKVTWFLHTVRFKLKYEYPQKPVLFFNVLWIDVWKLLQNKRNTEPAGVQKAESDPVQSAEPVESTKDSQEITKEQTALIADAISEKKKETLSEKIDKIIFKFRSIYDKIKEILDHVDYYINILQEEDTKQLLKHAANVLLKILKSIRPRILKVNGKFGFDTPDTTGKIYGLYCILRPSLGEQVNLAPDFEESVLSADIYLKGKITVFILVINALKILFDKRLGTLIKKLKNGGKHNV